MIGFQCPATVQPVFGRTPLFPASPQQPSSPSSGYQARQASLSPPNLLDYFPGLAGDGLRLNWAHAANSRSLLNQALMGKYNKSLLVASNRISIDYPHQNIFISTKKSTQSEK